MAILMGKARPVRVLILDNAIGNGGDAAILLAMQASLRAIFGIDTAIKVCFHGATNDPTPVIAHYPEICFIPTLWRLDEGPSSEPGRLVRRLLHKSAHWRFPLQALTYRLRLPCTMLNAGEHELMDEYRRADLIVVSGGGFLNSTWTPHPIRDLRIAQYRAALLSGVPLVFYAQSFGPFAPNDPLARMLSPVIRRAALVLCRDGRSMRAVTGLIGGRTAHVHQTMDEAMLLEPRHPPRDLAPPRRARLRIGVCPHQWQWPGSDDPAQAQADFERRLTAACARLLSDLKCELVFLTTHQGIEDSHQDAPVCRRVREGLPRAARDKAHLVEGFVHPSEFAGFMGGCDCVLSSRLHGAILSLVGGAPVIALAYEPKTTELMNALCLPDWTLSMWTAGSDQIVAAVAGILSDLPTAQKRRAEAAARGRNLALRNRELLRAAADSRGVRGGS